MQEIEIEKTNLSIRSKNCLRRANIVYVSQLMEITEEELSQLRNLGAKSLQEVNELKSQYASNPERFIGIFSDGTNNTTLCSDEYMVIEIVFPETIGRSKESIYFRQQNGMPAATISINEIPSISVRTRNSLHNAGITDIRTAALTEDSVLRGLRNMGQKSIAEIYDFLKTNAFFEVEVEVRHDLVDKIYDNILKCILEEKPSYDYGFLYHGLKQAISEHIEELEELLADSAAITASDLARCLLAKSEAVRQAFANRFYTLLNNHTGYADEAILADWIPSVLDYDGFLSDVLAPLIDNDHIEKGKTGYRKYLPHIEDWVCSLEGNAKTAVSLRLANKTLEECGQTIGLTRERVRQILSKAVKRKPILREDDYSYWYQTYSLDEEAMGYMFGTTPETFAYFRTVYGYGGKKAVEEMLNDDKMTAEIYSGYKKYTHRNCIIVGDEFVPINRELLCRKLAQHLCSDDEMRFEEFYSHYLEVLEYHGLASNEKLLFPSERAFEARLQDSMYVLSKYGRRLRYYPIHEYDIEEMVADLHLEQYRDIEISTLKLFVDNPELMVLYDVHDEYELHNLLNKTKDIWNIDNRYDVQITRMPFLVFGKADRAKQTEWLLFQIAPVTYEEFGQFYEIEFGVRANTALANMGPLVSKYYHDGVFSVDQPQLLPDEKAYMKDKLVDDFYFIADVQAIYTEKYGSDNIGRLNPRTYKELGFRVFTNYLVSDRYNNADHYFTYLFTREQLLDMSRFDSRLRYVQSANQALDSLRAQYDILEYEDRKYISFSRFESVLEGISKDALKQYVEDAFEASGDDEFFTIKSLKQKGFSSDLHNVGFGDWFNAGLLKNSKKIRYIKIANGIIFGKGNRKLTLLDFLTYVLKNVKKIDIYDLIEIIEQDYGVVLRRDKIIWIIKESELYYDSTMEKIYLSKEFYYEDLEML